MTLYTLLKMGCEIKFPSGYILIGDPSTGYIDCMISIDNVDKYPDGLRLLDRNGVREAINDVKNFEKQSEIRNKNTNKIK